MVGTIFLWMYWPSFNAATALAGPAQHRAILNTYYSLAACVLATFSISALLNPHKKFVMVMKNDFLICCDERIGSLCKTLNLNSIWYNSTKSA
jgi:hypothetical protein